MNIEKENQYFHFNKGKKLKSKDTFMDLKNLSDLPQFFLCNRL